VTCEFINKYICYASSMYLGTQWNRKKLEIYHHHPM